MEHADNWMDLLSNSSSGAGYMEKFLKSSLPYCERVYETMDSAKETEVTTSSLGNWASAPSLAHGLSEQVRLRNKISQILWQQICYVSSQNILGWFFFLLKFSICIYWFWQIKGCLYQWYYKGEVIKNLLIYPISKLIWVIMLSCFIQWGLTPSSNSPRQRTKATQFHNFLHSQLCHIRD